MKLFRLMKTDADGKPVVGSRSMMLGVRPIEPAQPAWRPNVPATAGDDPVQPLDGGLSCYTDPSDIAFRPKRVRIWSIDATDLPPELVARFTGPTSHHQVEPPSR